MSLDPIQGFRPLKTHHCITGSMRQVYAFNGHDLSEELLLGLGEGVGFMYWQSQGQLPFLGGRAAPRGGMESLAGRRTGVGIAAHKTTSLQKSHRVLLEMLGAGTPVMLQVDMGFLPYFKFNGQDYHFGGHVVVACGYDPKTEQVLIADRDGLHPVPLAALERARSSTYRPFPPKNGWWTFDFAGCRPTTPAEIRQAIAAQASGMLTPPISNFGVKGIRLAANRIPGWHVRMTAKEIRQALFNVYIFVSPVGGTGGGIFRYMFSRFLREAAGITGDERLLVSAGAFQGIADAWETFASWAKEVSESPDPNARLEECAAPLLAIADQEQAAWEELR